MAEANGGRTGEDIDNKGNLLESIRLSDQNLNIRRGLAQFAHSFRLPFAKGTRTELTVCARSVLNEHSRRRARAATCGRTIACQGAKSSLRLVGRGSRITCWSPLASVFCGLCATVGSCGVRPILASM